VFDAVQIVGALLVLGCFLLAQVDRIDPSAYPYLLPNLAGSIALATTAAISGEWGFVFLEGSWALFSAYGLTQRLRGHRPSLAH
jgi:hypothetical protein